MKLPLVFVWGFAASLAVVGGAIWLFAAYETANWWPWTAEPRLSQNEWFEVVRNAVTTAAALGVGVTLFFSYRRQQTAERTQLIAVEAQLTSAKAQQTAAEALELSNKQHALDQSRRRDAVKGELHNRYAQAAEQLGSSHLSVRLAGLYSLAALADDWADNGYPDERQVCIDLLGAYFRSVQPGEEPSVRRELAAATLEAITSRLRPDQEEKKSWSKNKILLADPGDLPWLNGVAIQHGGSLRIRGARLKYGLLSGIELTGGLISIEDFVVAAEDAHLSVQDARLLDGRLRIGRGDGRKDRTGTHSFEPMNMLLQNLTLDGATFTLSLENSQVVFVDCVFRSGDLRIMAASGYVAFHRCKFEGDVFRSLRGVGEDMNLYFDTLRVTECSFADGVPVLEDFGNGGKWPPPFLGPPVAQ